MKLLSGLAFQFDALVRRITTSVVSIEGRSGLGSGVVWDSCGLIVSNDHVIRQVNSKVVLHDGRAFSGRIIARDSRNDLALLKVEAQALVAIERTEARELRPGEIVLAVGHPLGLRDSASFGIVSNADSTLDGRDLVCADIRLAPGNSGGPLVDASGRLLGIVSMISLPGTGLAIPTSVAENFVNRSLSLAA